MMFRALTAPVDRVDCTFTQPASADIGYKP